eukprot:8230770-Pyramimonas_sp.AAC.1
MLERARKIHTPPLKIRTTPLASAGGRDAEGWDKPRGAGGERRALHGGGGERGGRDGGGAQGAQGAAGGGPRGAQPGGGGRVQLPLRRHRFHGGVINNISLLHYWHRRTRKMK